MRRSVFIGWSLSSFTGWGVYGLNLSLAWARDADLQPVCTRVVIPDQLALDPLRQQAFRQVWADSAALQAQMAQMAGHEVAMDAPHLVALGPTFAPTPHTSVAGLKGQPDIGVLFTEFAQLEPAAIARAKAYPVLVAGSTWNAEVLQAYGLAGVHTILQGVDTSLFRPGPRNGWLGDRFCIFSGGKLELRKGQDIVMAAFRIFAGRHPEALLVTAWHSHWPQVAKGLDQTGRAAPIVLKADGEIDVPGWAEANGLRRDQILDLGRMPNMALPQVLAEMDLAVFPNRAEGGTNLVAMEAMACGVPTVLSANTGHLDLIEDGAGYALTDQQPVGGVGAGYGGTTGWGESSTEELVAAMERAYADRDDARRRGERGAVKLAALSWRETARRMKQLVLSTRPA
ncbi:MAG: mshA 8 [Phenylobacterium sp.]|nr:mshA 8 [Phenylobacterium sp.]